MSGHPIDRFAEELQDLRRQDGRRLTPRSCRARTARRTMPRRLRRRHRLRLLRPLKTKKGDRDGGLHARGSPGAVEVVVFPETFGKHGALIENGRDAAGARQVRAATRRRRASWRPSCCRSPRCRSALTRERADPVEGRRTACRRSRRSRKLMSRHRGDRPRGRSKLDVNGGSRHVRRPRRRRAARSASGPSEQLVVGRRAHLCGAGFGDESFADARSPEADLMPDMMPDLLEFEEPIGVLLKEIEALSMLPQHAGARRGRSRRARRRANAIARRALSQPDAVAARPGRAPPEPPEHARLRRAAVHRLRRAARRSPLRRRSRHRHRHRRSTRASRSSSSGTRRAATPSRRSTATSATRARRAIARRCG